MAIVKKAFVNEYEQLTNFTPQYAGFYVYNKSVAFNITVADTYHAFCEKTGGDVTPGLLSGWTQYDGRVVSNDIVSEGDGSPKLVIEATSHGLLTGDLVVLGNMNNAAHNKPTRITKTTDNIFSCDDINYVAGAGASSGTVMVPSYLMAGANSAGVYTASFCIGGTASNANKNWKWELNINILAQDNIVTERNSTNSLAAQSSCGHITIAVGDRVWLSGKNITDTTDYTVKNLNVHLHKIS
jgi:hypothetical protein